MLVENNRKKAIEHEMAGIPSTMRRPEGGSTGGCGGSEFQRLRRLPSSCSRLLSSLLFSASLLKTQAVAELLS